MLAVIEKGPGRPRKVSKTMALDLAGTLRQQLVEVDRPTFPSDKYRADPNAFLRDILGIAAWGKQVDIIEAIRDHTRVAVSSGHRIGKSLIAAGVALWFYCSFPEARVIMTSVTTHQVTNILWRELRIRAARSGVCLDCRLTGAKAIAVPCPHSQVIDGEIGTLPHTGLKSVDFREIKGLTTREPEAFQGLAGANLLFIADEASGIPQEIFDVLKGNSAGGAKMLLLGNPTRNRGEFFDAFYSKAEFYKSFRVSSEETPNFVEGREVIPGLATREWVEQMRREWGENSPLYKVRVKGEHALHEEGKIFSLQAITDAEARWAETLAEGRLWIGLDPAGPTGTGDSSSFCMRRGKKVLAIRTVLGFDDEAHLALLLSLIDEFQVEGDEPPVVVLDSENGIGSRLSNHLAQYSRANPGTFHLVPLRVSSAPEREPENYDRLRDELFQNLESWFRDGGAIVADVKLAAELQLFEYFEKVNGKIKVTPKDVIRKLLGRSPDRCDSLALSCWEPRRLRTGVHEETRRKLEATQANRNHSGRAMSPYDGMRAFGRRR